MARRTLSTQGRIVAAGLSVAVGGALVGFMAAGDHTADARQNTTSSATTGSTNDGSSATPSGAQPSNDNQQSPYDAGGRSGSTGYPQVQPQTRTGGS